MKLETMLRNLKISFMKLGNRLGDMDKYMEGEAGEGLKILFGIVLFVLVLLLIVAFDKMENRRFRRWNNRYGMLDDYAVPWRTVVPWHKMGSKWFDKRRAESGNVNTGSGRYKDPYGSGMNGGFGKGFGNSYGGFAHGDHRRGKGNFGDGRGSGAQNFSNGPR